MPGKVLWLRVQDQCYGIVSLEVPYQEASRACAYDLDSTLARLPLNISDMNVLQQIDNLLYNVHINPEQNYWVSGKCKYDSALCSRCMCHLMTLFVVCVFWLCIKIGNVDPFIKKNGNGCYCFVNTFNFLM